MTEDDAVELIRAAVPQPGGQWADLGAGTGTFTRALAVLVGSIGHVEAIEPDAASRRELVRQTTANPNTTSAVITARDGDLTLPLGLSSLQGILMANSLHFVPHTQQAPVLRQLVENLLPGGRIVLVEYDHDIGNQWVPYPVSLMRFVALCKAAGLAEPTVAGRMPSAFGGKLYSAWTTVG